MSTMRSIITAALRRLGANSANAVPTAEDTDVCLQAMNALIDSLSNDLLNIHTITPIRFLLTPLQQTYTLGPRADVNGDATGADWVVERPMRIETAVLMVYPTVTVPSPPDPVIPSLYTRFVTAQIDDGLDENVGVVGFFAETNTLFTDGVPVFSVDTGLPQTDPIPGWYGTQTLGEAMSSVGFDSQLYVGGGDAATPTPTMEPMAIGTRSVYDIEYGYYSLRVLLPAREGDLLWVTDVESQTFNSPVVITVVVGPSATEGEVYIVGLTGSDEPYSRTISAERTANIGGRT